MMFFFDSQTPDGKFVYAAEDKGTGRVKFIFDNNQFETGRFIRADGKELVATKIK